MKIIKDPITGERLHVAEPGEDRQIVVPLLSGGIADVDTMQYGIDHMEVIEDDDKTGRETAFRDIVARPVYTPIRTVNGKNVPIIAQGYDAAWWEVRHGNILPGPDGSVWIRVADPNPNPRLIDRWMPLSNLENRFGVEPRNIDRRQWPAIKAVVQQNRFHVIRGVKFTNCLFTRTGIEHDAIFDTLDSHFTMIPADDPRYGMPCAITFDIPFDEATAKKARSLVRAITQDKHSADNFLRWFATPGAEPFKQLSGVWAGQGRNCKGATIRALRDDKAVGGLFTPISATKLFGQNGFGQDNLTAPLADHLYAVDAEASKVTLEMAETFKRVSTGDPLYSREVQKNGFWFTPMATFLICTNLDVILSQDAAGLRRACCVRMRDNIPQPIVDEYLRWINAQHGVAGLFMASCRIWEQAGDSPWDDIQMGDPENLTDHERWLVDQICSKGWAIARESPYYNARSHSDQVAHRNAVAKLGLKSGKERVRGKVENVLKVRTESRFAPYREAYRLDEQEAMKEVEGIPDTQIPLDGNMPHDHGFKCDYVEADEHKIARNWKRTAEDPMIDTSRPPQGAPVVAVVPRRGFVIIDMDMPHGDGPTGWQVLNREVGAYGSLAFASTYLTRTPSGGCHAYYRLAPDMVGRLKNAAHSHRPDMPDDGIPVDVRVDGKGYAIAPGSTTEAGAYRLVDCPEHEIPCMPRPLYNWLIDNGYGEQSKQPDRDREYATTDAMRNAGGRSLSSLRVNLSPIAEGGRNDGLYRWACGLMAGHGDESANVRDLLYQRGRVSGLQDREIEQIWRSVLNTTQHIA